MCKTNPISVLMIAMMMSAGVLADEPAQPQLTPAAEAFIADLERASRSQSPVYFRSMSYTDNFLRPLPNIDFEDGSLLDRVSHFRRVSFLTVAEIGQTQFFFGLNSQGLLGLHFNIDRKKRKEQLELLRMPYLVDEEEESAR